MIIGSTKPSLRKHFATIFASIISLSILNFDYFGMHRSQHMRRWQQQLARGNLDSSLSLTNIQIEFAIEGQEYTSHLQTFPKTKITTARISSPRKIKTQSFFALQILLLDKELQLILMKTFWKGESAKIKNLSTLITLQVKK